MFEILNYPLKLNIQYFKLCFLVTVPFPVFSSHKMEYCYKKNYEQSYV